MATVVSMPESLSVPRHKTAVKAAPSRSWLQRLEWRALCLMALVVVTYWGCLSGEFLWDDDSNIVKSVPVRTLDGLRRIWFEPGATQQYYPVTHTSFWLDYQLWGLRTTPYHVENVLLHALSAVLLWYGLKRLKVKGAWLGAALFALHPVQVESVAWITERKNTLSGVFFMASLLAAIAFWRLDRSAPPDKSGGKTVGWWEGLGHWKLYWLSVGLYILGMGSKTAIIGLPAVILVLVWWKRGRFGLRDLALMLPYLAVAAGLAIYTIGIEKERGAAGEAWSYSLVERGLIASRALCFYLGKIVWPHPLMFMYPRWTIRASQLVAYVPALVLGAGLALLWFKRRNWGRPALAALGIFVAMLFPVLGFFNVVFFYYSYVCDHFQYLAMVGPVVLVAAGLVAAFEALPQYKSFLWPTGAGLLLVSGALTWRQTAVYQNLESLWVDTLAHNPESWMAHDNMGTWLSNQGQFEAAAIHYREAIRLHPADFMAYNNLGLDLARAGNLEEAAQNYAKALKLRSDYPMAHYNLGNVLAREGKLDEAISHFSQTLKSQPDFAPALFSRGTAYSRKGDTNAAFADLTETLRLQPEFTPAHLNLARLLSAKGKLDEAIEHYRKALDLDPNSVDALANLGNALVAKSKFDDAIACYQAGLRLDPGSPVIHYNLGVALAREGRQSEAQEEFAQANRLKNAARAPVN